MDRIKPKLIFEIALYSAGLAVASILLSDISWARLIARDEGFYTVAAKLVAQGKHMYHDFFYTQTPLMLDLYALWLKLFGSTWHVARGCSLLLTLLILVLLTIRVRTLIGPIWTVPAALLFTLSHMVFGWLLIVETFALSTLLLFLCYLVWTTNRLSPTWRAVLCGVLLGLATSARLFFLGVGAIFPYLFLVETKDNYRASLRLLVIFCLGVLIGLIPCIPHALRGFELFWFNNVGYHLSRSDYDLAGALKNKWVVFKSVLGIKDSNQFIGASYTVLLIGAFCHACLARYSKRPLDPAIPFAWALFALNLVPTPSYVQYFCTLTPFLIIPTLLFARELIQFAETKALISTKVLVTIFLALALYLSFRDVRADIAKFCVDGVGVPGIGIARNVQDYRISSMERLARLIDKNLPTGGVAIALWPGHLFASRANIYPGLENHFGLNVGDETIDPLRRQFLKVLSRQDVIEAVAAGRADLVVASEREVKRYFKTVLQSGGYKKVGKVVTTLVFKRSD